MVTEERILSFDEDVEVSEYVRLDEGVYEFTYCGYTEGNTNPKDGGVSYPTAIIKMNARNAITGDELETDETIIMTTKWQWKLSQLWLSLGCEEYQDERGNKKVKSGWRSAVGRRGYFEVTENAGKKLKDDGTPVMYRNKKFLAPSEVQEAITTWRAKLAGSAPAAQPAPQSTAQTGTRYGQW